MLAPAPVYNIYYASCIIPFAEKLLTVLFINKTCPYSIDDLRCLTFVLTVLPFSSKAPSSQYVMPRRRQVDVSESDALLGGQIAADRFSYVPRNCFQRLLAGTIFKSKLRTSEIVRLPFNRFCKYFLVVVLLLSGLLFSPEYVPKWLGFFDWRSNDLCPPQRVDSAEQRVYRRARLSGNRWNAARHEFEADCFEQAASAYYGPAWRDQSCELNQLLAANAQKAKICVGPTTVSTCSNLSALKGAIGAFSGICRTVTVPQKCREATEATRAAELLELERERTDATIMGTTANDLSVNANMNNPISVSQAAIISDVGSDIATHLMAEADFASNAYIVYSVFGLIVGIPLVLYKQSKSTRMLDIVFGMRKNLFIVLVIGCITVYDAIRAAHINLDIVWRAWDDPCGALDPRVASAKTHAVMSSCSTISGLALNASNSLQRMDQIYYDVRRYAVCQGIHHPSEALMESTRQRFRSGDLRFRGTCNASMLMSSDGATEEEEEEEKEEGAEFKNRLIALLLSGVIAQIFIKVVFSSWIMHVIGFIDPMVMHSGKVEIWDSSTTSRDDRTVQNRIEPLNHRERRSAISFARDSHLLPAIFLTITLCAQVVLIAMSKSIDMFLPDNPNQRVLDVSNSFLTQSDRYNFQCLVHYP